MSILELILVGLALLGGARFGIWLTNKQRDSEREVENVYRTLSDTQTLLDQRIDDVVRDIHTRIDILHETFEQKEQQ